MLTEENAVTIPPQLEQVIGVHSAEVLSSEEFIQDVTEPPEWAKLEESLYIVKLEISGVPPNKAIFEINTVLTNSDSVLQIFCPDAKGVSGQIAYILHTENSFDNLSIVR